MQSGEWTFIHTLITMNLLLIVGRSFWGASSREWMTLEPLPLHNSVFDVPDQELDKKFCWLIIASDNTSLGTINRLTL